MRSRVLELLRCKVAGLLGNRETAQPRDHETGTSSNAATQQPSNPTQ